jgi:tetratricopeptide (TPR) repeat protein
MSEEVVGNEDPVTIEHRDSDGSDFVKVESGSVNSQEKGFETENAEKDSAGTRDTIGDEHENGQPQIAREERSPVFETRLEKATEFWESGKTKFRQDLVAEALKDFEDGLYQLDFDELSYNFELMDKHRDALDKIRIPLWLNCCSCFLRQKRPKDVIEYSDKVLKHEPKNVKALFRKSKANEMLGENQAAFEVMKKAWDMDQTNVEVGQALVRLRKVCDEDQKKVDAIWRGKIQLPPPSKEKPSAGAVAAATEADTSFFLNRWFWIIIHWIIELFNWIAIKLKVKRQ